ncbi:predicted protein [Naegleria gruberi]|uniref:Predicted protein n=1 Tax=Naegleria gruberi TaxID=5762 RepID=D2V5C3_NAEGR|nr:uncharacterized protein NAEGRDRAFT_63771 [Naegleria gruberi]EFC47928.1 predicted protein [Naegleria gruberi]|eukprot:XP_002680672.1 predicted protein [Naegleria gruberi strain NEG-M]
MEKRNSFKHNKNIFSFDDRYHQVFNDTNNLNNNLNNTNNNNNNNLNNTSINNNNTNIANITNVNHSYHHNVHSLNDGNLTPSTPFNQSQLHVPFSLQKRTSILSKRHFKHVSNSPNINNSNSINNNNSNNINDNIFDLQVKTNERKFRILILNNFRSVSKRVKFTLLEIFKYKKVILGDKIIDIPYEFICICDTLELPSPLLNEFIGFVPTLCANTTITIQDIQNYSTNIQHIIQQQLNRLNEQTNLIDCVDMTVKIQQYIREIIIQCRNHQYIKKYPTSEALPFTVMACKAYALIYNKTFVTPTHVQSIISNLLFHRIECISDDKWNVIQQVVSNVLPP